MKLNLWTANTNPQLVCFHVYEVRFFEYDITRMYTNSALHGLNGMDIYPIIRVLTRASLKMATLLSF